MEAIVVILIIANLIIIIIQLAIVSALTKDKVIIGDFAERAQDFIRAFNEVKNITNNNNAIFSGWGAVMQQLLTDVEKLKVIQEIHGQVLQIKPPKFETLERPKV